MKYLVVYVLVAVMIAGYTCFDVLYHRIKEGVSDDDLDMRASTLFITAVLWPLVLPLAPFYGIWVVFSRARSRGAQNRKG